MAKAYIFVQQKVRCTHLTSALLCDGITVTSWNSSAWITSACRIWNSTWDRNNTSYEQLITTVYFPLQCTYIICYALNLFHYVSVNSSRWHFLETTNVDVCALISKNTSAGCIITLYLCSKLLNWFDNFSRKLWQCHYQLTIWCNSISISALVSRERVTFWLCLGRFSSWCNFCPCH